MSYMWCVLILLRLGLAVWPQPGYIHPDEFFQTVEVVAGDALNISVERTWEFTSSYPLRSVVLPQLTFSPIFKLLRYADDNSSFHMTGYHLIAGYRLMMALLSLWIDTCIFKICRIIGIQGYMANILYASSYVTLTFQTHTFSNSFETVLFISLIWLMLVCLKRDEEHARQKCTKHLFSNLDKMVNGSESFDNDGDSSDDLDSSFNDLHKMAFDIRKRNREFDTKNKSENEVKGDKGLKKDPDAEESVSNLKVVKEDFQHTKVTGKPRGTVDIHIYIALMALTLTAGVFNRPTYIIFTLLPLLWWVDKNPIGDYNMFKRMLVFTGTGVTMLVVFVAMDTVYFTDIEMSSIISITELRNLLDNAVITPLNFLMYNSMPSNLESHGRHPFFVHMLVNMPLLFGPLLLFIWKYMLSSGITILRGGSAAKSSKNIDHSKLSVEEKVKNDLAGAIYIFILFPVILLSFFPHQEARFLIPISPLLVVSVVMFNENLGKLFWIVFVSFNVVLTIVFGVLHQGGVIPCLLKLQSQLENELNPGKSSITVIFSHTYMPPKHLLISQTENLQLLDLKGSDFEKVVDEIKNFKHSSLSSENFDTMKKVFLVLPGTLVSDFKYKFDKIKFRSEEKLFPHLSFEDLPDFNSINSFKVLADNLSLYLFEID